MKVIVKSLFLSVFLIITHANTTFGATESVDSSVELDDIDADGNTLLHRAAMNPNPQKMLYLIESLHLTQESFLNSRNREGRTPLGVAYDSQPKSVKQFNIWNATKLTTYQTIYEQLFGRYRKDESSQYYTREDFLTLALDPAAAAAIAQQKRDELDAFEKALRAIVPEGEWLDAG